MVSIIRLSSLFVLLLLVDEDACKGGEADGCGFNNSNRGGAANKGTEHGHGCSVGDVTPAGDIGGVTGEVGIKNPALCGIVPGVSGGGGDSVKGGSIHGPV